MRPQDSFARSKFASGEAGSSLASPEAKLGRQLASPEGEAVLASPEASTGYALSGLSELGEIFSP